MLVVPIHYREGGRTASGLSPLPINRETTNDFADLIVKIHHWETTTGNINEVDRQ
jgi:hypothetical protein